MRNPMDSPFLRSQEAKYGTSSSFSLGPALHEPGGQEVSSATDHSQSTADLTAFVRHYEAMAFPPTCFWFSHISDFDTDRSISLFGEC